MAASMTKKQKKNLKRIIIALATFVALMIADKVLKGAFSERFPNGLASVIPNAFGWLLPFALFFAVYVYIGHDVLKKSFLNIKSGSFMDENFLMSVATIGAFALGIYTGIKGGDPEGFDEGCAVLIFYQVGEWFQSYAVGKSRRSITSLMDIRPDYAVVLRDGEFVKVDPSEVNVGDTIKVVSGEKIPLDGVIVKGETTLDTKALTGESLPQEVNEGTEVLSGSVNVTSTIEIRVTKPYGESTVSKILELVENASTQKSKSENFITKFAKYYTPSVVIAAVLLAIVPPVVLAIAGKNPMISSWIYRALSFLVVSCPCAVVISVPLSFFAGIGGASANGILIKGSIHLERFNQAKWFVFDKTGTLTKGNFAVTEVCPENNKDRILRLAAIAEKDSSHPIALSIKNAYGGELKSDYVLNNVLGKGIKAVGETEILCGNGKLMDEYGVKYEPADKIGTVVYVAENGEYAGYIVISDEIKPEARETIEKLNAEGCKTVMFTGDNQKIAEHVAKELGLTSYKASLLPQNKVEEVDKLLKEKGENELLCFVGDGINDAPVLMKSDVGISMGGVGSDAAIEASDVVLMRDDLSAIPLAKKIARKTMAIVRENIIFALGVKLVILILSALGIANMWIAVFGDVGVAVLAILNAMRANYKVKDKKEKTDKKQ